MPPKQPGRGPRESKGEKLQCHVHDQVQAEELDDIRLNVCASEFSLFKYENGKTYCLFHLPTREKDIQKFEEIFDARLKFIGGKINDAKDLCENERKSFLKEISYDFRYVWFPDRIDLRNKVLQVSANFLSTTFSASVSFRSTTFSAFANFTSATFAAPTDFIAAKFSETTFNNATFSAHAHFTAAVFSSGATFVSANFAASTHFAKTTFVASVFFNEAQFLETSQLSFVKTRFLDGVYFDYAVLAGYVKFEGTAEDRVFIVAEDYKQTLNLQNARIDNPERISFHRVRLHPEWFVNVDPRKFIFIDVKWENLEPKLRRSNISAGLSNLSGRMLEPSRLFEIACRQLAVNAEDNNRYEQASQFRLMANDTKRLESSGGFTPWTLHWWYWLSSSYGESWQRAIGVLSLVLLVFALGYTTVNFYVCPPDSPISQNNPAVKCETRKLEFSEGIRHSLATALFQNVEYRKPVTWRSDLLVLLEKIFAPLQAALLALAIRRKFMR